MRFVGKVRDGLKKRAADPDNQAIIAAVPGGAEIFEMLLDPKYEDVLKRLISENKSGLFPDGDMIKADIMALFQMAKNDPDGFSGVIAALKDNLAAGIDDIFAVLDDPNGFSAIGDNLDPVLLASEAALEASENGGAHVQMAANLLLEKVHLYEAGDAEPVALVDNAQELLKVYNSEKLLTAVEVLCGASDIQPALSPDIALDLAR